MRHSLDDLEKRYEAERDSSLAEEIGHRYESDGNKVAAFPWYLEAARHGRRESQFAVASFYESGDGVERDYAKARIWYERAAANGDHDAALQLGGLYENPDFEARDTETAILWYKRAAQAGHSDAAACLGVTYDLGADVPRDLLESVRWYRIAADAGDAEAKKRLLELHREEGAIPDSEAEAIARSLIGDASQIFRRVRTSWWIPVTVAFIVLVTGAVALLS